MGDSSYESLLDISVSAAMASIRNMSYEQLSGLLNDSDKIEALIDKIPQIRTLPTEREMGLAQNKSLAEWNLSQEPKLEEAKRKLTSTHEEAVKAKEEVTELKKRLDAISEQRSLDSVSVLLQAAAQTAEDESEAIAERYMNSEIETDQFLKEFIEKKTLAHMRKVKSEKLMALLRQQQFHSPPSNSYGAPYPVQPEPGYPVFPQPPNIRPHRPLWS